MSSEMTIDTTPKYVKVLDTIILVLSLAMTVFQIGTARLGVLDGLCQQVVHLLFIMVIGFLYEAKKSKKQWERIMLYVVTVLTAASLIYNYVENDRIMARFTGLTPMSTFEMIFGIILVIACLELARRTIGLVLPVIAIAFMAYSLTSSHFPGILFNKDMKFNRLIEQMFTTNNGIFGDCIRVSSTFIFLFVFFGSILEVSGGGEFFMDVAKCFVGKQPGGPGLMAVVSSALMGTISGSAVANVMTTGVFTIPLMRRVGFEKNFAGAVEAVASTGGQILPPIMGSAAFLMAEIIGAPYSDITKAAILPAALYFIAVFLQIFFEARKTNMQGLRDDEIPRLRDVLKDGWTLSIPLVAIVIFILSGWSTQRSGYMGILTAVVVTFLKKKTRLTWPKIKKAALAACKSMITVASACACAGMIVCVVQFTGISMKFSSFVVQVADGRLVVALFLCMIAALVLGMGLPTPAAYVIQASLTAPALINMGLSAMQAHLFILYFSSIAVITPPVALAAFAAASLSEGNASTIGFKAFRLGLVAFIVPYMFAYGPGLILEGGILDVVLCCCTALIGVFFIAAALSGWFRVKLPMVSRVLLFGAAVLMLVQGLATDAIGLLLGVAVIFVSIQIVKRKTA